MDSLRLAVSGWLTGQPAVDGFYKRIGAETVRPFPGCKPGLARRDEVAAPHHFVLPQGPETCRGGSHRRGFGAAGSTVCNHKVGVLAVCSPGRRVDSVRQTLLGFTSSTMMPPTSASAPAAGGMK